MKRPVALPACLVAILTAGSLAAQGTSPVPVVVKSHPLEAAKVLRAAGFEPVHFEKIIKGDVVVRQVHEPGEVVKSKKVELVVERAVPHVVGKTLVEAKKVLVDWHHHVAGKVVKEAEEHVVVLEQEPRPGKTVVLTHASKEQVALKVTLTLGIRVPDVKHATLHHAVQVLEKVHLRPEFKEPAGTAAHYRVAAQGTAPGTVVPLHARVHLALELAPHAHVPNLVGKTLAVAETEVKQAGLAVRPHVTVVTRHTTDEKLVGRTVIDSQSVEVGKKVARESVVEVKLVTYKREAPHVHVPNLVGKPLTVAEAELKQAGLAVRPHTTVITRHTTDEKLIGRTHIESQSVEVGKKVARESVVEVKLVTYKREPAHVHVPHLVGKTLAAAKHEAEHHGVVLKEGTHVMKHTTDEKLAGRIVVEVQSVKHGHRVAHGSVVEVHTVHYVLEKKK